METSNKFLITMNTLFVYFRGQHLFFVLLLHCSQTLVFWLIYCMDKVKICVQMVEETDNALLLHMHKLYLRIL